MTATSNIGSFSAQKYAYSRYMNPQDDGSNFFTNCSEMTWVTKRYAPTDLRVSAPVPRHKIMTTGLPTVEDPWKKPTDPPLRSFERTDDRIYSSHPSSRSEDWSTLRQILPSRGTVCKPNPLDWGTGLTNTSVSAPKHPQRFPVVNSPMTRYVDAMHLTNRLYKLH